MQGQLGMGLIRPGQRVGLLGGSFDPPHHGHLHIATEALQRFGLDLVILLVSPGNPLKRAPQGDLAARMAATRALVQHPRIRVSDAEARLGTRFTAETLGHLQRSLPGVHLVWLMGADNLAQFHRWDHWQEIIGRVPLGVLARPGHRLSARFSLTARRYRHQRVTEAQSRRLPLMQAPAWCFVTMPLMPVSSSQIRAAGQWQRHQT